MCLERGKVHDRLELNVVLLAGEEEPQDLAAGDFGSLPHADSIAQARNLDGVPKRHQVTLGRGLSRIDVSQAARRFP